MGDKLHRREGNSPDHQLRPLNDRSVIKEMNRDKRSAEAVGCQSESVGERSALEGRTRASSVGRSGSENVGLSNTNIVWEEVLIDQKEESTSTDMPLGTAIHNIEITLGKGGQLARAAGAVAKLIAKEGKSATLKLPSGEVRLISKNCSATVGQVGNVGVNQKNLGRAGSKCWLGKRPIVRGVVMNPVDHPHGGGEGRAPIGRKNPQLLGVFLHLEEEVEKGRNIVII
ncbi:unnamed protein product [Sphenostylis stenocarpa]|uniref:Large ribosomal subunit protein uL2 C-terminal domain-containing protein n=1 Tax=Sphenostylis stenocarpa TaxID=92480 RepID=A0AA86W420_9FABA|nr:unnamed protein product [Sphenostylis stenocarpa]